MNLVPETLNETIKSLRIAAGLVIIHDGAILLGHPTHRKWWGTYSIPKGEVKHGESLLRAAIRETYEEVGIKINPKDIKGEPDYIEYTNELGVPYKRVYYFVVILNEPIIINLKDKTEIDWAGFITPEKAEKRIYWRLKPLLNLVRMNENLNEAIKHLSPRTADEIPDISYKVTAQAFDRLTGASLGESRDEIINPKTNRLFTNCYNIIDIKEAYESFWNDMNPNSEAVVFVSKVIPLEDKIK